MRLFLLLLFVVLAGVGQAVVDRTYYIYLGLDISATQAEIAAAYAEKKIKIESLEDEQARQAKSKLLEEGTEWKM